MISVCNSYTYLTTVLRSFLVQQEKGHQVRGPRRVAKQICGVEKAGQILARNWTKAGQKMDKSYPKAGQGRDFVAITD